MQSPPPPAHGYSDSHRYRPRISMACANCRKRKVKCITTEDPPQHACKRCTERNLQCQYLPVESPSPTTTEFPLSLPIPPLPGGYRNQSSNGGGGNNVRPISNIPPSPPRGVPSISSQGRDRQYASYQGQGSQGYPQGMANYNQQGYSQANTLPGGMAGYQQAGYPSAGEMTSMGQYGYLQQAQYNPSQYSQYPGNYIASTSRNRGSTNNECTCKTTQCTCGRRR